MKIIIEQDMEGCAGVFDWRSVLNETGRMSSATRIMTDEVNAAAEGAFSAGASEVLVMEAHTFDRERLHPGAKLVTCPLYEIKEKADALFFIGRHAMSGVADGILNHTGSSRSIREARINGRPFGELGIVAGWFGRMGTPTALVAGDEAACREAREFFGEVETVAVKWGGSCRCGISLSPSESAAAIKAGAGRALKRLADFKPFTVSGETTLEITYRHSEVADWVCRACRFERADAWTVRYRGRDFPDAVRAWYQQGPALYRFDA